MKSSDAIEVKQEKKMVDLKRHHTLMIVMIEN